MIDTRQMLAYILLYHAAPEAASGCFCMPRRRMLSNAFVGCGNDRSRPDVKNRQEQNIYYVVRECVSVEARNHV